MVWTVHWEDGFIVGGDSSRRLTPSFRLREFEKPDGTVRVHRELVAGLQLLRDRFAKPLSVRRIDADGLGAVVSGDSTAALLEAAEGIRDRRVFDSVNAEQGGVRIRIADPGNLSSIELEQALETAFSVTAGFETAGDKFQQITGNFDGAGLSFGPAQVNFKSGTLVPLFRRFKTADEAALRSCFADQDDYQEWLHVMDLAVPKQIEWANGISTGRGQHDVVEPWRGYLQAVGRVERFRVIMVESLLREYGARTLDAVKALQTLKPDIQIDHLRCVCSLYDLVVQQGSLDKAWSSIEERVSRENPQDQFALIRIAVEERGRAAAAEWQADCVSRRVGILKGVPETVSDRQRANINFYMLRDVRIRGARELMNADVSDQIVRVSEALAGRRSLLT